jgi:hypothetical protein
MFKVKDRVKIAKTSQFYGEIDSNTNPMNEVGTISEIAGGELGTYVNWDNGRHNSYNECDLELVIRPQATVEEVAAKYTDKATQDAFIAGAVWMRERTLVALGIK